MNCRLCLQCLSKETAVPLFGTDDVQKELNKIITKNFDLKLSSFETNSSCICKSCFQRLNDFRRFCLYVEVKQYTMQNNFLTNGSQLPSTVTHDEPLLFVKPEPTESNEELPEQPLEATDFNYRAISGTDSTDKAAAEDDYDDSVDTDSTEEYEPSPSKRKKQTPVHRKKTGEGAANKCAKFDQISRLGNWQARAENFSCNSNNSATNSDIKDMDLYNFLKAWELPHLYSTFFEQKITLRLLKWMKEKHIDKLFQNIALGDQILFEYKLNIWQKQSDDPREHFDESANSYTTPLNVQVSTTKPSLKSILKKTHNGRMIMKYYEQHKIFHESQRILLINTVAKFIEASDGHFSLKDSANIEKEILEMFPTEKLEFYRTGKRGRLYNKVANLKRSAKNLSTTSANRPDPSEDLITEEEVQHLLTAMRSGNVTPEEFMDFWKRCSQYRFQQIEKSSSIKEILRDWPEYKQATWLRMIDVDFDLKYPSASSIVEVWREKREILTNFLKAKIITSNVVGMLQTMHSFREDSMDLVLFWSLHHLFPPLHKFVQDSTSGTKVKKRFTIADSQEAFVLVRSTAEEVETQLKIQHLKGCTQAPCLVVIGQLTDAKESYVYFDGRRFPMDGIVNAVDVCFKIFRVLNIPYPEEAEIFYNFMQSFFYGIPPVKTSTRVYSLINDMNSFV